MAFKPTIPDFPSRTNKNPLLNKLGTLSGYDCQVIRKQSGKSREALSKIIDFDLEDIIEEELSDNVSSDYEMAIRVALDPENFKMGYTKKPNEPLYFIIFIVVSAVSTMVLWH